MPPVFADVTIPDQGELRPTSVLIVQTENAHDVATFVASPASLPDKLREMTPVHIQWGYRTEVSQDFYGYVHHVEPLYVEGTQTMKVVCIGASMFLQQAIQHTWNYQSYDTIVTDIATSSLLSADVEAHNVVWPYTVANGSAWDFMLGLADQIGYVLAVNGTEIRFLSPAALVSRGMTTAPLLTVQVFRPIAGLTVDETRRRRLSHGMDTRTGKLFTTVSGYSASPLAIQTDVVADSPGAALAQHAGIERRSRFPIQADVEADGDAAVAQGSMVYIQDVADDYIGQWFVHQVEHDIAQIDGSYVMYLRTGRATRGAWPSFTRPGQPTQLRTDPFGELTGAPPPTVLTGGRWRSGWARRSVPVPAAVAAPWTWDDASHVSWAGFGGWTH
jgi:phage protein D